MCSGAVESVVSVGWFNCCSLVFFFFYLNCFVVCLFIPSFGFFFFFNIGDLLL